MEFSQIRHEEIVDYDVRDMIDCKVNLLTCAILMKVIVPWMQNETKSEFDRGFAHGKTMMIIEEFVEHYKELFDEENSIFHLNFDKKSVPRVEVVFGKKNVGLEAEYESIIIGGAELEKQIVKYLQPEAR